MPELPEVEVIRRYLDEKLRGRVMETPVIRRENQLARPDVKSFQAMTAGRVICGMQRRGKYLKMLLDDGSRILFHLRMTGSLVYEPAGRTSDPYARALFPLRDGSLLVFADVRTFGRIYGLRPDESDKVIKGLAELGPEPLSPDFTPAYLAKACQNHHQPIKSFLLDQRRVAGIGNIYADESLFLAGIYPARPAMSLTGEEYQRDCRQRCSRSCAKASGTAVRRSAITATVRVAKAIIRSISTSITAKGSPVAAAARASKKSPSAGAARISARTASRPQPLNRRLMIFLSYFSMNAVTIKRPPIKSMFGGKQAAVKPAAKGK